MESTEYCRELAAPAGSSLYYATVFYKPEERNRLLGIFALLTEFSKTVSDCQDPGVARMKLQWWMEELERLYSAKARHPVTKWLQTFVTSMHPEKKHLQQLIRFAEKEINPEPVASINSLLASRSRNYGPGWRIAASVIPSDSNLDPDLLYRLAGLYASVETMQTANENLIRGYCVYPEDLMAKHGLNADDLLRQPSPTQTSNFLNDIFVSLQSELNLTLRSVPTTENQLPVFAICLALIARAKCSVFKKQPAPQTLINANITPLKKLWLSWKASRQVV